MSAPSRIIQLASQIQAQTSLIDEFFRSAALPFPSFDVSTPPKLPHLPKDVAASIHATIEAVDELHALLLGPIGFLLHQLDFAHNIISLHAVNAFSIPSYLGTAKEAQESVHSLAQSSNVDLETLSRLLKHAASNHIFCLEPNDTVTHTSVSLALARNPLLRQFIRVFCEEMWPVLPRLVDALKKWPKSEDPGETAWNLTSGKKGGFLEGLADRDMERGKRFVEAMAFMAELPGFEPAAMLDFYPKGELENGLLVDVGGGDGSVGMELVRAFSGLRVVVQDLPAMVESARREGRAREVERLNFMGHDFFEEQPIHGADVYLLRMILHNWGDGFCINILRKLVPALKPRARILINDFCIKDSDKGSLYAERTMRSHDLSMKAMFNGKERDQHEWGILISKADSRFTVASVKYVNSSLALIEIIWEPGDSASSISHCFRS